MGGPGGPRDRRELRIAIHASFNDTCMWSHVAHSVEEAQEKLELFDRKINPKKLGISKK
jgi:hypothetical protein